MRLLLLLLLLLMMMMMMMMMMILCDDGRQVNPWSANVSGVTVQRTNFSGRDWDSQYSLTRMSDIVTSWFDDSVLIVIGKEDMDHIKVRPSGRSAYM
jgi:hypothetical protein